MAKTEKSEVFNKDLIEFKDCHLGETAIFFGSGPTVKKYHDNPNYQAIRVGVNETINLPFQLDYAFFKDAADEKFHKYFSKYRDYKARIAKFVGRDHRKNFDILKRCGPLNHTTHYFATCYHGKMSHDFTEDPPGAWASVSIVTMQILLWMGFKRIILVGHDCNYKKGTFHTHFKGNGPDSGDSKKVRNAWNKVKELIDENYPDVEMLILNPDSLRLWPEIKSANLSTLLLGDEAKTDEDVESL